MAKSTLAPGYRRTLNLFAWALCACTLGLLFVGGMVTSTNSGLSVPDWPTTYNYNMFTFPPSMMVGGIFYEHGHRLFASAVGLLTVILCLWFWIGERRAWLRWTGTGALLLVIVQGVLGGLTVRMRLPMPVSASHAMVAELFFLLTGLMAFATTRTWLSAPTGGARDRWLSPQGLLATALVALAGAQILVGAVMRHSYAGLAIPTFPRAIGGWIPSDWNFGVEVNFLHTRVGAALVAACGCALAASLWARGIRALKILAAALVACLSLQVALGALTIWTGKAPVPASLHLAMGALTFQIGFQILLVRLRLGAPRPPANGHAAQGRPRLEQVSGRRA